MDLLVTLTRQQPDGTIEHVAHSADRAVVDATVAALERILHGAPRRRVLQLAEADEPAPVATPDL